MWEVVAGTNEFCFGGALCVDVLAFGFTNDAATTERDYTAGMAAHVMMDCEGCVNPGIKILEGISTEAYREVNGSMDVFKEAL